MFRADEGTKRPVLKELKLKAKEMVRSEAVSNRVSGCDEFQGERIAELERRVELSEREPAVPKTEASGNKSPKREERGSCSESRDGTSS